MTRLSADGSRLVYSTFLGGSGTDSASGIAVDAAGNAHVVGSTTSTDFPRVRPLPEPVSPGTSQAVVAKLSPDGSRLIYSVLLGGSASDLVEAVAIDPAGNAVVYGVTSSKDFPVRAALQPERASDTDLEPWAFDTFLSRLSPGGALLSSTYLGAGGEDRSTAIAIDRAGFINLLGYTASPDFPLRDPLPIDIATPEFFYVGHLTRLDPQASEILFSTFLDGTEHTEEDVDGWAYGMSVDAAGSIYVTGETDDFDFPIVGPSHRTLAEPTGDVFALKIDLNAPPGCTAATASPAILWPANGKLFPVRIGGVSDPDGDPVTVSFTAIRQDEPLSKKGQPDATGLGTSTPLLRADRAGKGDGRVYHITFIATDSAGAACTGTVTVCVPHDRGKGHCSDGGPLVDSAGGH